MAVLEADIRQIKLEDQEEKSNLKVQSSLTTKVLNLSPVVGIGIRHKRFLTFCSEPIC